MSQKQHSRALMHFLVWWNIHQLCNYLKNCAWKPWFPHAVGPSPHQPVSLSSRRLRDCLCLSGISACVSEGEAVSNQSSLQAHSTTPGGITQLSERSGCGRGSSDTPTGSRPTVSNECTRQSLSKHPGPKEMYALVMSGMTNHPPTPRPSIWLARNWNSYLLLIPNIPSHKTYYVFFLCELWWLISRFPVAFHRFSNKCTIVNVDTWVVCLDVSASYQCFFYQIPTHKHTRSRHKSTGLQLQR